MTLFYVIAGISMHCNSGTFQSNTSCHFLSRRPSGRPRSAVPQGLTWRVKTGESSPSGGLGPPPATTTTSLPEAGHRQNRPIEIKRFTDTQDNGARGTPRLHKKPHKEATKRKQAENASRPTYDTRKEWSSSNSRAPDSTETGPPVSIRT